MSIIITSQATGGGRLTERFWLKDIREFKSQDKYTVIKTKDGKEKFPVKIIADNGSEISGSGVLSVRDIESFIEKHTQLKFIRINRGHLLNNRFVKAMKSPADRTQYKLNIIDVFGGVHHVSRRNISLARRQFSKLGITHEQE